MNLHDLEKRNGNGKNAVSGKFLTPAESAEALRIFGSRVSLEGEIGRASCRERV